MRLAWSARLLVRGVGPVLMLTACASAPPPAPGPADREKREEHEPSDAGPPPAVPSAAVIDMPERSRPPSTATYEQAMSKPESVDVNDARTHLTDVQLREPVRGVIDACHVPPNAKITIKTAVQNGRAVGVTVDVRFEHPPPTRKRTSRPTAAAAAAAKREAKAKKKVTACVDHAVREVVWPPSNRRDSFTTDF